MKSTLSVVFIFFFFTCFAFGQTYSVSGRVVDSTSREGLDFITIGLKNSKGEPVRSFVTKNNGVFQFEKVPAGKFRIAIVAVGYHRKELEISVDRVLALGDISIRSSSTALKEVLVMADKPLVKQEVDRLSYDVQADPESKVNTLLDMMRKVPLLSVDGDDNVKLKGSGSYKILINGRPSAMLARDPKEVLKSMPASDFQKIEVITTPPAKYDSEGLAGIINIITNKKVDAGYNASINARGSYPAGGPGGSASITVKEGAFGISGWGGLNSYHNPGSESFSRRLTSGSLPTSLQQSGRTTSENTGKFFSSELSFEIDSLNLITAEIGSHRGKGTSDAGQLSSLMNTGTGLVSQGYHMRRTGESGWTGMDAGINYQMGFKRSKEQFLTLSYKYNRWGTDQFNGLAISQRINYEQADYQQTNEGSSDEQTVQLDYIHPVGKLNIEAGLKGIVRNNRSDFQYRSFNGTTNAFETDPSRTNRYKNDQHVLGIYNSYQYSLKDWGIKAGLRLEQTTIRADFISTGSGVDEDFLNFIPSVSVSRKFKDMSSLNLGYTQRIERPGIWQLNPFVDRANPNFHSSGNPDLVPVLNNSVELSYSRFKKASVNIALNYSFANNTIQEVTFMTGAITRSTYDNIGRDRTFGSSFNMNYPITQKLNLSMGGNLNYIWIEGVVNGSRYRNDGMQGYMYAYAGYRFEKGWRSGINYSYSSPWVTLQGQSNAYNYLSLSMNKEVVKDKLTLSASVSNPFQKYRSYVNNLSGSDFSQTDNFQSYYRRFNASLNYRFGKLKGGIKKNARGIKNDDVKSGGGGGTQ